MKNVMETCLVLLAFQHSIELGIEDYEQQARCLYADYDHLFPDSTLVESQLLAL